MKKEGRDLSRQESLSERKRGITKNLRTQIVLYQGKQRKKCQKNYLDL